MAFPLDGIRSASSIQTHSLMSSRHCCPLPRTQLVWPDEDIHFIQRNNEAGRRRNQPPTQTELLNSHVDRISLSSAESLQEHFSPVLPALEQMSSEGLN